MTSERVSCRLLGWLGDTVLCTFPDGSSQRIPRSFYDGSTVLPTLPEKGAEVSVVAPQGYFSEWMRCQSMNNVPLANFEDNGEQLADMLKGIPWTAWCFRLFSFAARVSLAGDW